MLILCEAVCECHIGEIHLRGERYKKRKGLEIYKHKIIIGEFITAEYVRAY